MRRRAVVIVALTLALATAAAGVALAVAATTPGTTPGTTSGTMSGTTDAAPTPSSSLSASPPVAVAADDYCYVEAMIYYRVEEKELAEALLRKEGVDAGALGFATGIAARNEDELEDLRAWYVSWADARPVEPPADGPCGGHGADHAQMPGMPSWSALQGLVEARHPEAERRFAEILQEQNAGMVALIALILDGDPHPAVVESAEKVRKQAEADGATLAALLAGLP